jgi:hypothetical protein
MKMKQREVDVMEHVDAKDDVRIVGWGMSLIVGWLTSRNCRRRRPYREVWMWWSVNDIVPMWDANQRNAQSLENKWEKELYQILQVSKQNRNTKWEEWECQWEMRYISSTQPPLSKRRQRDES